MSIAIPGKAMLFPYQVDSVIGNIVPLFGM